MAATTEDAGETESRRKSGRSVRKPEIFGTQDDEESGQNSAKRKRPSNKKMPTEDEEEDDDVESSESDGEDDEDEADEEEVREERRKQRKKNAIAKPVSKRSKTTNGASTTLAIRSANIPGKSAPKSSKQKARARPSQVQATGLYAEVFGHNNNDEEAAAHWHEAMQKDNVAGIRDLVNFILQCTGCDYKVETSDIEDIDNVPAKLGDVLEEYVTQNHADYPLASRSKQFSGMKEVLVEFFSAVIRALHGSGTLYDEPAVYDNIHIWTATMSGAGYRSFRHTATVISLSMTTALCEIAKGLQESMAYLKTQIEGEKKKKTSNKTRIAKHQEDMKRDETRLELVDTLLRDAFDTVYVHRYRDVDEKIRVECAAALGGWIMNYRKMFLEGQYLRYLGWVLSDPNAPTRTEVIRQLKALFKIRTNIPALRAFTDRFRSRIVEMGARDTDTNVRVETIELLDRLRNAELLEPQDIDTIGQLIFDNELKVRRAVAKFFVSNIEDLYGSSIEDFDDEQFKEILPAAEENDDFTEPTQSWIKFKCLAQTLGGHNKDKESYSRAEDIYGTEEIDSRYMLATQSIFPFMNELHHWESLAGYLLHDHSRSTRRKSKSDLKSLVQEAYKLESGEETILLDVLYYAVKMSLQAILDGQHDKKGKKTNLSKKEIQKRQETAAHKLSTVIPQLLNKFGSTPEAAASILRLEQILDVDLIGDLHSGEGAYISLLDDINKQFVSHSDRKVLVEATKAFRAARTYETSKEAADAKLAELWSESNESLATLLAGKDASARGTLDRNVLRQVADIVVKLAQLASVSDCCEVLDSKMSWPTQQAKRRQQESFIEVLLQLVSRGIPDDDTNEALADLEDKICHSVTTVMSFYFRWKVVGLKNAIAINDKRSLSTTILTNLAIRRSEFGQAISPVITDRLPLDPLRINAMLTIMDIFTLFATVRYMKPEKGELDDDIRTNLNSLVTEIDQSIMTCITESHEKMEKRLAKKTSRKKIELPLHDAKKKKRRSKGETEDDESEHAEEEDIEKPPEDSDDEGANDANDSSSEDEDNGNGEESEPKGKEGKKQAALVAEQALCELTSKIVLGLIADILPQGTTIKARLQLNRTKLGKSYGQIIAYLDEKKEKKAKPKTKPATSATPGEKRGETSKKTPATKQALSEPMIVEDDDIEDDDEEEPADPVEDDDPEVLRDAGLDDDPVDEEGEDEDGGSEAPADEDDVMGD